ncbi:MAG TPA: hypothetical protein VL993_12770 [Stellaceae bacterium]|nr:hypothetical protein [Stellaceae bacterium]
MPRFLTAAALAAFALATLPALAAEKKEPPSCAAIAFRPVASGLTDGVQDAGLYKSRFGRIEVKANVKGGASQGYFVEIDGKPLDKVSTPDLPPGTAACAKVKRLSAPTNALDPCTGDRLTVLITHGGDKRYFLLYGHTGGSWRFCSAGAA